MTQTEVHLKILVTGSARLDIFRQTEDSLVGRFFLHRLMPFDLVELNGTEFELNLDRLVERGGFPEPFLAEDTQDADRWRAQYIDGLIRTDVLAFEDIREWNALKTIFELLRRKVGSTVSYSSLARDAEISPATAKRYVLILEALFIVFRVSPFSKKIARSILKEPKIYFFDSALVVGDEGKRFENTVAVSLYKNILQTNDQKGTDKKLHFIRTKNKEEIDFAIAQDERAELLLEAKVSDKQLSKTLKKISEKLEVPAIQLVKNLKRERSVTNLISIQRASNYLSGPQISNVL